MVIVNDRFSVEVVWSKAKVVKRSINVEAETSAGKKRTRAVDFSDDA